MSKIKNNIACLGDALLMDIYPGAKVINKNKEVDFSTIHLSGQTKDNFLVLYGPRIGERKIDLGIRQDSALNFIAENINSFDDLEMISHVVIGQGDNPEIYRLTRENKTVIDITWDWINRDHKKSNWKEKRPSYTYPSLSRWERLVEWWYALSDKKRNLIFIYFWVLLMIVVTTTVIIAEKVSQIENKIISETSLNRKCEALKKLGKAHSYTSDIETVGKDSIVITDRNFEELGMQDVLFVKYGNGDWYPVNDDKRLSYFQVNRIVTNAYINLIWKNNN